MVSDKGLELRAGTNLNSEKVDSNLAITGAARTEELQASLVNAIEAARFDEVIETLSSVGNKKAIRPMLRTLRRKLIGDEREGAKELQSKLIQWME